MKRSLLLWMAALAGCAVDDQTTDDLPCLDCSWSAPYTIDGKTVEEFRCAGVGWTRNPQDCSGCGDDPATAENEAGRCLDENNDRIPDIWGLIPGLATIRCPGVFTYTTVREDGYYYPSGNQTIPAFWARRPRSGDRRRATGHAAGECRVHVRLERRRAGQGRPAGGLASRQRRVPYCP